MSSTIASSTSPDRDCPCFPPELFLEILAYTDKPALAALSTCSYALLELSIPFLYHTMDAEHLPSSLSSSSPSPATPEKAPSNSLAPLLPNLALSSIRTLHLTPSARTYPRAHLPNLLHLHIHTLPHPDSLQHAISLLSSLNPTFLAFHLSSPLHYGADAFEWGIGTCHHPINGRIWEECTRGWNRLEDVLFEAGTAFCRDSDRPNQPRPLLACNHADFPGCMQKGMGRVWGPLGAAMRVTYDCRRVDAVSKEWILAAVLHSRFAVRIIIPSSEHVSLIRGRVWTICGRLGAPFNGQIEVSTEP